MNNNIKKQITTEKGITYELKNGCYYPVFELPEQPHYEIGKYGLLHLNSSCAELIYKDIFIFAKGDI